MAISLSSSNLRVRLTDYSVSCRILDKCKRYSLLIRHINACGLNSMIILGILYGIDIEKCVDLNEPSQFYLYSSPLSFVIIF